MKGLRKETRRIVVPEGVIRVEMLINLHDSLAAGHPGWDRMYHLVSRYFFWRGMKKGIEDFT